VPPPPKPLARIARGFWRLQQPLPSAADYAAAAASASASASAAAEEEEEEDFMTPELRQLLQQPRQTRGCAKRAAAAIRDTAPQTRSSKRRNA
jgi:hypothetical protein